MTYHDWTRSAPPTHTHQHPGGYTDLSLDPRQDNSQDSGGWVQGARGITRERVRNSKHKGMRKLLQRQAAHKADPPMADGSQPSASKPRAILPGSTNPRKH